MPYDGIERFRIAERDGRRAAEEALNEALSLLREASDTLRSGIANDERRLVKARHFERAVKDLAARPVRITSHGPQTSQKAWRDTP